MLNRCTMLKHPVHSFVPLSYMVMLQDFLWEISHKMTILLVTGGNLHIINVSCFETYHLSLNQFDKFKLILRWGKN